MRIRLADYIADFLVKHSISDCFTVVGGGAMYLNDAFGHKKGLTCHYNHHEQASAIASESYARLQNKPALLCVTTGPGGTNAITGVLGAWLDSIPMFVISGQVRYDTTARYAEKYTNGLSLRSVGDQEFDITKAVSSMCKYAKMLENPNDIRYMLEEAWFFMQNGRKGPVWLDIPIDFQKEIIETENLLSFKGKKTSIPVSVNDIETVLNEIRLSNRPVIYAGGGIRLSGAHNEFIESIEKLGVPVVTYWNSIDLIEEDNQLYCGRGGNMGDRAGNFAVQNSDLVIAIGTRISIRQTGYNWKSWARAAKVIMVDIDEAEMKKHTIHVDFSIIADAKDFLNTLLLKLSDYSKENQFYKNNIWKNQCQEWKRKYPVVSKKHWKNDKLVNVYAFMRYFSEALPDDSQTAVSNGACCVVGHQVWKIKRKTRFIVNNAVASMGYGLPAAFGLCVSSGNKETICLEGDGSIMMNLQELQTIVTANLPIKIFIINNNGYHSIRQTQNNIFKGHTTIGIGPESNDLSFPSFHKIADAFGYPYFSIKHNSKIKETVSKVLSQNGFVICEVFTDTSQAWEPKNSAKVCSNGDIKSAPLEDMAPFLSKEELAENMIIPLYNKE